ncbi:MAG: 16S rRNA (guanine(966)-N(2))-methyltransferase RsmD [Myxococcota bacterium]|nr:16S rRNA (guanine(966)-N(2))-methyltransferase RsmD [Myxococcota bacterium]
MRITGGRLRGQRLPLQRGSSVRPTSDRVREALFSIIGQDLTGCKVLDAFGGSGILTIEAISRGASRAVVFERDPRMVRQCADLMKRLGISDAVRVRRGVVPGCLPESGTFDLAFVDPPYAMDATGVLERIGPLCQGVIVLEHRGERPQPAGLTLVDGRSYGDTELSFFRAEVVRPYDET